MLLVTLPLPEEPKTKRPLGFAHQSLPFHVEALLDQFLFAVLLFHVCCADASRGRLVIRETITARAKAISRLPTECRHGGGSASGHTLPVGFLDNGNEGVFRTQENASQQKKNQVATPQN
jgi:hypothetical protein